MNNHDILIRLRYALDLKNNEMIEIFKLGDIDVTKEEVMQMLTKIKEDDEGNIDESDLICTNRMLESFLNGLIIFKRGKQEPRPGQTESPVQIAESANNMLMKKLKIALALTSEDMLEILEEAGVSIAKGELSAILRKKGHRNYKVCGDRYARNFLKGLALKYRV